MNGRASRRLVLRAATGTLLVVATFGGSGGDCGDVPVPPQTWTLVEDRIEVPGLHSQGIASVPALGPTDYVYSSRITIDRVHDGAVAVLRGALDGGPADYGYDHLGDLDAFGTVVYGPLEDLEATQIPYRRGFGLYDAETVEIFEGSVDTGSADYAPDADNAWVAVSPDGRWLATSEWDPQTSVFLYRTAEIGAQDEVDVAATIPLDATIRRIQGCDFDGPRLLVCASDDGAAERAIYAIVLSAPVRGAELPADLSGHVVTLFPSPLPPPGCQNDAEVEGVDVIGDELRVLVIGPCLIDTHRYRFVRVPPP